MNTELTLKEKEFIEYVLNYWANRASEEQLEEADEILNSLYKKGF